jgi:NAD(P)-dependent dehydrogenase (short-subunit alcohol dehydrogenase family)
MQDLEYWADRRVLVTGGASGMGRSTVLALLARGAEVIALDRDARGLAEVAETKGGAGTLITLECDLADPGAIARAFAQVGPLDIAVNAAAIGHNVTQVEQIDFATLDKVIAVNFRGVLLCMQQEIPLIRQRGRGGAIINVSSGGGLKGAAGLSVYCATKHAVIGLTRSVSAEVAREGIRVNAVCPGTTDTPMLRAGEGEPGAVSGFLDQIVASTPIGRLGKPEEIADAILWLAGPHSSFVVGAAIVADGGSAHLD